MWGWWLGSRWSRRAGCCCSFVVSYQHNLNRLGDTNSDLYRMQAVHINNTIIRFLCKTIREHVFGTLGRHQNWFGPPLEIIPQQCQISKVQGSKFVGLCFTYSRGRASKRNVAQEFQGCSWWTHVSTRPCINAKSSKVQRSKVQCSKVQSSKVRCSQVHSFSPHLAWVSGLQGPDLQVQQAVFSINKYGPASKRSVARILIVVHVAF